jgi:hypothetical protein
MSIHRKIEGKPELEAIQKGFSPFLVKEVALLATAMHCS